MRPYLTTLLLIGGCFSHNFCLAQNEADSKQTRQVNRDEDGKARRDRMHKFSASVRFFEGSEPQAGAQLADQPILRFDDNARENNDGTVWVWGRTGRPVAVAEIFSYTGQRALTHTGHSLSTKPLVGNVNGRGVVTARKAGISLQQLNDAPIPATTEVGRMRQFKQLSRRFTAHEFWRPAKTRYELRPLPQPLYRYRDPGAGIIDGVIFAFCHGTNPEVIMLIELVSDADETAWQFAFARLAHAECHVELDGLDVWNCVRYEDVVPAGEAYWTFSRSFAQVDNPQTTAPIKSRLQSLFDSLFDG